VNSIALMNKTTGGSNDLQAVSTAFMVIIHRMLQFYLSLTLKLADLVLRACNDLEIFGFLTHPTLTAIDSYGGFDNNIIYAILHEAIYCQG
jgi:hypothetical protein